MFKTICYSLLFITASSSFCGCYRMPSEDDYSLVPTTNNAGIQKHRQDNSLMPKMSY
jgi:hypothetical protein